MRIHLLAHLRALWLALSIAALCATLVLAAGCEETTLPCTPSSFTPGAPLAASRATSTPPFNPTGTPHGGNTPVACRTPASGPSGTPVHVATFAVSPGATK